MAGLGLQGPSQELYGDVLRAGFRMQDLGGLEGAIQGIVDLKAKMGASGN